MTTHPAAPGENVESPSADLESSDSAVPVKVPLDEHLQ